MPLVTSNCIDSGQPTSPARHAAASLCLALWLCVLPPSVAQSAQPASQPVPYAAAQKQTPPARSLPSPALDTSVPAVPPASPQGRFPSDAATQPAKVMVRNGKITVEANNSDLPQILAEVANITGVTIKGLNGGPRVFGVSGPADPRELLTALLVGSGYNFIMVGGSGNQPPRELLLTSHKDNTPVLNSNASVANPSPEEDDNADDSDNAPPPPPLVPESGTRESEEVQRTLQRLKVIHDSQPDPPPPPQ